MTVTLLYCSYLRYLLLAVVISLSRLSRLRFSLAEPCSFIFALYAPRSSFDRRWGSLSSSHRPSRGSDLNEVNFYLSTSVPASSSVPFPLMRRPVMVTFLAFAAISPGV